MKTIDRIMAAYQTAYKLTEEQTEAVRQNLSQFVNELLAGRLPEPPKSKDR